MRNLIAELQIVHSITRPLTMYYDNRTVVFFIKNNKSFSGSKHLELKYLTIEDLVKKEDITVDHIDIESMLVDPLTKDLRPICLQGTLKIWTY